VFTLIQLYITFCQQSVETYNTAKISNNSLNNISYIYLLKVIAKNLKICIISLLDTIMLTLKNFVMIVVEEAPKFLQ